MRNKVFLAVIAVLSFSQSTIFSRAAVSELLEGYLSQSLSIKNQLAEVKSKTLSEQSAKIQNTLAVELTSGTILVKTTKDGHSVSFSPSATLTVPQASNLKFTVSTSVEKNSKTDLSDAKAKNTSLELSADLYSGALETRKITLLKANRSLLEAQRKLQNTFLSEEKAFYSELQNLYKSASQVTSAQKTLYDDKIKFEEIKIKQYAPTSSKYRLAEMAVREDMHNQEKYQHELERETKIFASKCKAVYTGDPLSFLPTLMPECEAIDVLTFDKETYTEIESASWTHYINTLTRKADKIFTLTGSAGYTFKNTSFNEQDSIDTGLGLSIADKALSMNYGVSISVDDKLPIYKFGITLNPSKFLLEGIDRQQKDIASEQELNAITSARDKYDTAVITQQTALSDLQWNKSKISETYNLYSDLAKDSAKWYKDGLISESEYKGALVNKENYRLKQIINDIDMILYNNTTKLLFTRDSEYKEIDK